MATTYTVPTNYYYNVTYATNTRGGYSDGWTFVLNPPADPRHVRWNGSVPKPFQRIRPLGVINELKHLIISEYFNDTAQDTEDSLQDGGISYREVESIDLETGVRTMREVRELVAGQSQPNKPDEKVWVDDGIGPIVAIYGDGWSRPLNIRQPVLMSKYKVQLGMKILDKKALRMYNDAIKDVENRKKRAKSDPKEVL